MNTVDILKDKFGDRYIPLEKVAAEYFGVTDSKTIGRMALRREFGSLRPFKARDSKQSPWMVDIVNLADTLDRRARDAAV